MCILYACYVSQENVFFLKLTHLHYQKGQQIIDLYVYFIEAF